MDTWDHEVLALGGVDSEIKEMLGLFDVPSFARRGQDVEYNLARLRARCGRERAAMLDMVRLRLRQWAGLATGPGIASDYFAGPIDDLWPLAGAEPPVWARASISGARRKLRTVARDLVASVERFNRRWGDVLGQIDLKPLNQRIDGYNRFYLLEKECSLGSARLAARHFEPKAPIDPDQLRAEFPLLPVPVLKP